MLVIPIEDKLRSLRLRGMLKSFQEQRESPDHAQLDFEERLGLMIDREVTEQENRRLQSRLKRAKLRQQACMENIDYRPLWRGQKFYWLCLSSPGMSSGLYRPLCACCTYV